MTPALLLLRAYAIYHKSPIILILGIAIILGRCVYGLYVSPPSDVQWSVRDKLRLNILHCLDQFHTGSSSGRLESTFLPKMHVDQT